MPLRQLTEQDLDMMLAWRNAPEVRRNMYSKHEITAAEHQAWFARLKDDATARWFIHEDATGQPDGVVYFTKLQSSNRSAFWGFYVAPDALPGTATRLGLDALDNAFTVLGLHKLNAEAIASNEASLRYQKKMGFKEEGQFRDFHFDGKSYVNVVRLGILTTEWTVKRDEIQARIAKLDALTHTKIAGGGYKIVILTDQHSWIAPYVADLTEEWSAAGHDCHIAHNVNELAVSADFCFCLSFSRILPADVRAKFKHTLVVHESDLPQGRGWAPMTWQILEGNTRIPVTLLEAVDAVDAGPIYLQEWIDFDGTELNQEWRALQAESTNRLCTQWVQQYPAVLNQVREQVGAASFYSRRRPTDSQLDVNKTLTEQFNLMRVVDNEAYPAFFEVADVKYKIFLTKFD